MFNKHRNTWYYYTRSQRRGFVILFAIILIVQALLLFVSQRTYQANDYELNMDSDYLEKKKYIDSLYQATNQRKDTVYPFNPNYITDYRGQMLEMTIEEIDRLHRFRAENNFVNSVSEFQHITQVSDEWIEKYSPFFQFPKWVTQKQNSKPVYSNHKTDRKRPEKQEQIIVQDINQANAEDLQKVRGIGPVLSERIIQDRNRYGGYVLMKQLHFVYGLEEEVLDELAKHFEVRTTPVIKKVKVNEASINELKDLPYLNYYIAREIVKYRSMNGDFTNKDNLKEIDKFPLDKIDIISLYLEFTN